MTKTTTVHHGSSDSRARLPILIAVLMLLASMVFMGSALTGTAQAQDEHGAIPSMALASGEPGQLVITWEAPSPAPTDYRIRWANTDLGWLSWSGTNDTERANEYPLGGVTTFTLSGLTPGDDYKVQIRSRYYNADRSVHESSGPWTNTATQRVKDHPPAAPTGLAASQVAHDSLTLSWNDPQDANITGYRIQRGTEANSLSTIEDNTESANTSFTDSTVGPETTYHYAVIALSQDGDGAQSTASVTTLAEPEETVQNGPPAAPTGLIAARIGHSVLTLTWDDPQDANITGYRVMRGTDAGSLSSLENDTESASTSYADATVEPETTYRYAVVALSADGDSSQSSSMSATTPAAPKSKDPPPQRVGARQSITTTEVPADWGLKPTDVAAGSQFRLIFLSSTKRNGSPTTISNYNIFVQGRAAAGHTDIRTHSAGFKAVVCTAAADARDNTNTTGTGVPIYWLNGTKVADNYGDFYDGSWDDEANDKNESGTNGPDTSQNANYPLTGCEDNGTGSLNSTNNSLALGTTLPTVGRPNSSTSGHGPLSSNGSVTPAITRPMYGLSAVFQVAEAANTPATGAPAISGLLEAGQTLTASTTDIADPDGLPDTFNYQWKRYAADGTTFEADIGTDASTYTLTAAEEGKKVLVEVSFTDNASNSEGPLVSAVTLPIITASVVLVSNTAQGNDSDFEYSATVLVGQAFTAGNNPTGYTFTSVTIISEDPQGDDLDLELCEVGTDGNTPENCTVLTPPTSFTIGPLFFYAPTGSTLTLSNGSTYMVVFKSPDGQQVIIDGTNSNGEDASSLHNWSIQDKVHFEWPDGWALHPRATVFRIGIRGIVNLTAPGAPTGLSATARGSTKINLSWTAPDSTGGSDITGYKIESSSDAGSNWTDLIADTGNTNTAYQHAGLSPGDTRHYRVSAINSVGTSAPSNTANATTATVTDTTAPTVTSITRQDPTSSPTNSDTLTWRVTFSEAVESVDPGDFMVTGTTATLTVTEVTNSVYDVTASGGDLASVDGMVTLTFAANQNIADTADNELAATAPTGTNEPTFELDNTIPTFVSGTANGTLIVMTFSEELDPNSLPPGSAFNISTDSNVMVNKVSIEGTMVTLTVTPAIIVDQTVDVNNNAYAGTGTVPLKDFAGNEVQPAAIVGSYRVTNETPIGPPASLRAEAGDGRVRLVWTRPAGISQFIDYQFRHAPGASVPVGTAWIGTASDEGLTDLVSGLANGTTHAFELRGVRDSDVGAAATVSATPMADTCMLDLDDRREVWSATMTVGRDIDSQNGSTDAGYLRGSYGNLPQDGDSFIIGGASYTIEYIYTVVRGDGIRRQLFLQLVDFRKFTPAVKEALRFHWCSDSSGFDDPSGSDYRASNNHQADWSLYNTRELALSLPANNDATGTPDITGRALVGQTLTAGMADIADADGLPNASDFAWQWIRTADETDTPIQDATSSTYTLTDDDAGKQVKVVMSFTDSLSGVESLTSDAYPSSSTVQRVLVSNIGQTVITENDNSGELAALDAAQEFTTGSNETGYNLSSIDLELTVASTSNFPVVKLFSDSANRTEVATLTAPTNASTGKTTYTFTVPTAITLEGDTSYWVMAETGGGTWHTVGFAEDATPAPDWSIADRDEFRAPTSTGPFTTGADVALMIRVNGTVNNPFLENFRADAGNAQVTLRWDNPEDSSITRYQYRQRLTSERAWDPDWTDIPGSRASTTSYTVRNLANRAAYTFQIRAVRGNEPTATSTASATPEGPPTAPLAPRNLAARGQDQGITASWQIPPAGDERAPVTSYKVRYRQVGTSPWQNITRANDDRSATQEINNLTNRQHYQVQVAAVNRMGTGQWASVKATPQAPDSPPPAPTGDATLTLGILGLFWDNSTTGNTLWADTCTGSRSFRIIWDGPKGHDRAADEWAAHINTSGGAGVVTYNFREIPNHPGYYEMYGTVNFEGNGSLSVNVRGRFGQTWGTWSPTGSLYCYTTERPSRN